MSSKKEKDGRVDEHGKNADPVYPTRKAIELLLEQDEDRRERKALARRAGGALDVPLRKLKKETTRSKGFVSSRGKPPTVRSSYGSQLAVTTIRSPTTWARGGNSEPPTQGPPAHLPVSGS